MSNLPTAAIPSRSRFLLWLAAAGFIGALAAAFWRIPAAPAPAFAARAHTLPATAAVSLPAFFASAMLPQAAASAHAATLTFLPDGRLAAAWFAGSREGAADVTIWLSRLDKNGWSKPQALANRESTAGALFTNIRKLGNPVLFTDGARVHLWFVSVALGGWAGSSLNHIFSDDSGETWSKPSKLVTSPFLNISTLVRTPPLPLADGGYGLPAYHEFVAKHGEWLRLDRDGRVIDKTRMAHPVRSLQPAVVALDEKRALALLRDAGPGPGRIRVASTGDAGLTWETGGANGDDLPLPNPNASVAMLRLASGRLLLAGNGDDGRTHLHLWLSADEGKTWTLARTAESAPDGGAEFSYPALLLGPDGRIHLAYTWRRQGIKHAIFSEAWLDGGQP
ncbi:sialidase family protein [Dechloromonas sp. ZY10]|uniref:sialidase family protein n=1 Tax=Dechloromonas aquae TaxID=2664436 RepID=UPI0035278AF7